jgi:glycosyltransferase involved in cell wall biosynthesis
VPHAASPRFAVCDPEPFAELYGLRDFVLVGGAIEPRNHQLSFLWAVREIQVPVVVLGDVVPGCEWYLDECRRAASDRVRFIPHLDHDDQLRASAYSAATCVLLGGGFETSAQVALEAGMSGTALVLPEHGYAREYFGQQAIYVQPEDLPGMRRAVRMAIGRGRSKQLSEHIAAYFSRNAAGRILRQAYDGLLRRANGKTSARE